MAPPPHPAQHAAAPHPAQHAAAHPAQHAAPPHPSQHPSAPRPAQHAPPPHPASQHLKTFPESSFFKQKRAHALPTPAEIRELNKKSGNPRANSFDRPSPVSVPSLGLLVKYGGDVTIAEAQAQMMVREKLHGRVPVPEVYGWDEDGEQRFIYMELVKGDTLQARWGHMDEGERQAVCKELKEMVKEWRALKQDENDSYIGSQVKRPLNDVLFEGKEHFRGPFHGEDAVKEFQEALGIHIEGNIPIMFTHDDLVPPNILLTPGAHPKVAAVIDWGQAGWYPGYWEYCKARGVGLQAQDFSAALQDEWREKYLPEIVDQVDEEKVYHPWLHFVLSHGI